MTRILFVCGKPLRRSPKAAAEAERLDAGTDFAGLSVDADELVVPEALALS